MHRSALAALLLLVFSACSPQTSSPPPIRVAVSPGAQPLSQAIAGCVPTETGLALETGYPSAIDPLEFDLVFRLGEPEPDSGFAAQIAWEEIVLIVNPANQVGISRETAAALFAGRVQNWSELGGSDLAVSLWAGPESDEARRAFEESVLRGTVSGGAHLTTDPGAALEAVAGDPGAIAIMPAAWVDETVRQIDLDVSVPVIAVAGDEPAGAARELLACLQSPAGQNALSNDYLPFR